MLFTGSLRFNLTPFGEHSDAECWAALRRAHLADMIEGTGQGLDLVLTGGGRPPQAPARSSSSPSRAPCCATPRWTPGADVHQNL